MAFRCMNLLRVIRRTNRIQHNLLSTSVSYSEVKKIIESKEYKTENNLTYFEDPDTFGTLSRNVLTQNEILEDEDDIKEEEFIQNFPTPSQKLTTKQYADLIKQYLKHKRLKEAIDVLEIRMLKQDRVKPENYIYNILIGACADVGYTKKAFKLFNDMKRRALKPTGDTYTCLFHGCFHSPWAKDGLRLATNLRQTMIDKGVEPNITNFNAMIKAFGRCGDIKTAFQIVDEMIAKKIKIRVHTFNHLLQACITDKDNGLKHGLIVWRKMLKMREKPNIYSFNLMLRCVKDCNLGSKEDIEELIGIIQEHMVLGSESTHNLQIEAPVRNEILLEEKISNEPPSKEIMTESDNQNNKDNNLPIHIEKENNSLTINDTDKVTLHVVNNFQKNKKEQRVVPNLLSKNLQMQHVLALQKVETLQDKFAVVGGQEDFLKEMDVYSVKPDIKTYTQMLALLDDTVEAENKMLETIKSSGIKADIAFYNMLIKKRCLRLDYGAAFEVQQIIEKESKLHKRKSPKNKKHHLKPDIMTYGALALACKTKEDAEKLLNEMKDQKLKVNIEILGTLLRQGTVNNNFSYIKYIMTYVKEENIPTNHIILKHLVDFYDKCQNIVNKDDNGKFHLFFVKNYKMFSTFYKNWSKEINFEEALQPVHPWTQFREAYPDTVQRQKIEIKEPKKFYKRNRKFIKYAPPL